MDTSRREIYVARFSRSERAIHWTHAAAFFAMLGSGLVLYLPSLTAVADRPLAKAIHLYSAIGWAVLLVAVAVGGDRRGLRRTVRDLALFDSEDRLWLRRIPADSGRFNAGQKLNAALTSAFATLFAFSGFLLWYGERDTRFRFAQTIVLHDGLMYISLILLVGHLYLTLIHPTTRHSLRGMTIGSVRLDWAWVHHRRWAQDLLRQDDEAP